MNIRRYAVGSGLLFVAMLVFTAWAAARLPDIPMAVHWDMHGRPDSYWSKTAALGFGPVLMVALTGFFILAPRVMPVGGRLERSPDAYGAAWLVALSVLLISQVVIVASAAGISLQVAKLGPIIAGVALIVLGNFLPKTRYNYILGVRTPWTLDDEQVWDRTHRFIGPWVMGWGFLCVVTGLTTTGESGAAAGMVGGGAVVVAALALIYSYLASRSNRSDDR